jgi:hypothetical protein
MTQVASEERVEAGAAFTDVPRDARGHLGLLFHAAAFHLICHLRGRFENAEHPLDETFREHPFLVPYFTQIRDRLPEDLDWQQALTWLRDQVLSWENAAAKPLPLMAMRQTLDLSYPAVLAFVCAGMAEEHADFGPLFAGLMSSHGQHRTTLGLFQRLFAGDDEQEVWPQIRPLVDHGFLHVTNQDAPRSEWVVRVPSALWNAVRGECAEWPLDQVRLCPKQTLEPLSEMLIDQKLRAQLDELNRLAAAGRVRTIIVRGMAGTDRLGALGAMACALDRGLLEIECPPHIASSAVPSFAAPPFTDQRWALIGPLCTLTTALPVFSLEAGPGETFELPALRGYTGPAGVVIGREGGVKTPDSGQSVTVHLDLESPSHRLELWKRALQDQDPETLAGIASTFCLPGLYIRECAGLATHYAAMEGRQDIAHSDVRYAARALSRQLLDTLATRIDGDAGWSQLVVKDATNRELQLLEERCRHREQLASTFQGSMPGGMNRGVRALFEGPSGTGKTLAARVLATELRLDLYRVDLAAVVNKYIGETEKNLSRVLSRAEDLNVILLLDEGDSLMTRRTDVKSSNDRYANLETNYLLQRLEHYTGIVVVTTNAAQSIDPAFRRRMDSVVKFHLPDASQRWHLWRVHLPINHAVEEGALEEIALRYELTGGQIRNVCVNAALGALSAGETSVRVSHLRTSIQAEHRKAGATFVDSVLMARPRNTGKIAAFAGGLS